MKQTFLFILSLVILLASCKKPGRDLPSEGLLLHYRFDGNLMDQGTYNNDGMDSTHGKYINGKWGKALDFNGTSDYVRLQETLNLHDGLTLSFWVNSRGAAAGENNGAIISKYNMTGHMRCFMISSFGANETRSDNRLMATFYQGGIYPYVLHDHVQSYMEPAELSVFPKPELWEIENPVRLSLNRWVHCVINMKSDYLEVWLDNKLCVRKKREHVSYYDDPLEPTYIGNNMNGGSGQNNHFNGALDELRIYDRALTVEEIDILYHGG